MRLRGATAADRDRLLDWRNDPAARAASRNTDEIGPDRHREWFERVLADPERHLLIAELEGVPAGQVRFDHLGGRRYEISVGLGPGARGRGNGAELIRLGCEWLWANTPAVAAEAWVRDDNEASARAFAAAGFREAGEAEEGFRLLRLRRPG